jgi:LCP family protein required for cell wall assembly
MWPFRSKPSDPLEANFLAYAHDDRRTSRQTVVMAVVFTILVAGVAGLAARASYRAVTHGTSVLNEFTQISILSGMRSVFGETTADAQTPDPQKDMLNILVLGIGGEGHEGANLTDTIIYASIDLKEKKAGLVSIPRDTAYPLGGGRFEKINAVHAYFEQDHPGEGTKYTAEDFSKLLDTHIDHVLRIDFRGFVSLIDAIGGIDVNVERSFSDPQYPTDDDGWQAISFKKGMQHMDGKTALMFVRSRHGTNGEGSDFARSHRQQLVMMAAREKLLSLDTLGNPKKLAALYAAVSKNIQTDLSVWNLVDLASFAKDFNKSNVNLRVLTDAADGELVDANVNGAFMLFPRKQDWSEIRAIVKDPFTPKDAAMAAAKPKESVKIEIKNGTFHGGFASDAASKLEKIGYEVTAFGNANRRGYDRTLVFDLTGGKKQTEFLKLKKLLDADVSMTPAQETTSSRIVYGNGMSPEKIFANDTDFLVILGDDSIDFTATALAN